MFSSCGKQNGGVPGEAISSHDEQPFLFQENYLSLLLIYYMLVVGEMDRLSIFILLRWKGQNCVLYACLLYVVENVMTSLHIYKS